MRLWASTSIAVLLACGSAGAQDYEGDGRGAEQDRDGLWKQCAAERPVDAKVASCSVLIQSGGESPANLAVVYSNRGNGYLDQNELDRAAADYNEAIRLNSQSADAFSNRGNLHVARSEYANAEADFNEALRLAPNHAGAFNNRGLLFLKRGNNDRAISDFNEAIRNDPQLVEPRFNRGLSHFRLNRLEDAIADYSSAIKLDPQLAEAFYHRGQAYLSDGHNLLAIADFSSAISLSPDDASAFGSRGLAHSRQRHFGPALDDFGKAIRLDPTYAGAFSHRGFTHVQLRNYDQAAADFAEAIRLDPNHVDALRGSLLTAVIKLHDEYALALDVGTRCKWLTGAEAVALRGGIAEMAVDAVSIPDWELAIDALTHGAARAAIESIATPCQKAPRKQLMAPFLLRDAQLLLYARSALAASQEFTWARGTTGLEGFADRIEVEAKAVSVPAELADTLQAHARAAPYDLQVICARHNLRSSTPRSCPTLDHPLDRYEALQAARRLWAAQRYAMLRFDPEQSAGGATSQVRAWQFQRSLAEEALIRREYEAAEHLFEELAIEGDPHALFRLAGIIKDRATPLNVGYDWRNMMKVAAAAGHHGAIAEIGSERLLERSARAGALVAMFNLAFHFENQGEEFRDQALHWYRLAAEKGFGPARYELRRLGLAAAGGSEEGDLPPEWRVPGVRCSRIQMPERDRPGRENATTRNLPPQVTLRKAPAKPEDGLNAVRMLADGEDPEGIALLYTYSTTGGRIAGDGPEVVWQLPTAPGTYITSVEVNDGQGCIAFASDTYTVAGGPPNPTP